jgi:hypothetical protein
VRLAAALQVKDADKARHEVATQILLTAKKTLEESSGSVLLVVKSELPPAVNSPEARAAYAELFGTVYSRAASMDKPAATAGILFRGLWLQSADSGKLAMAALFLRDPAYAYAVSQLHVRSAASSPAVAALLLGPSAVDERCLR